MRNRILSLVLTFIFIFSGHAIFAQVPVAQPQEQVISIPAPPSQEPEKTEWTKKELLRFISELEDEKEIKKLHDFLVVHYEIRDHYVDPKSLLELLDLAMIGMVEGLDPYSHIFFDEQAGALYREFTEERNYIGTGISIAIFRKETFVAEVFDNSPAAKAGIEPGDQILTVNGKNVYGMNSYGVAELIKGKGEEGISAVLEIKNPRLQRPRRVTITLRKIVIESVVSKKIDKDIVYAKIRTFLPEEKVVTEFRDVLKKVAGKKLIIDLRDNGGGSTSAVSEMVGFIVGPNKLLMTLKGKDGGLPVMTPISARLAPASLPSNIVVLVNNFSASASEIMAGNLKHYKKAEIVGVRTFGKATAQNYMGVDTPDHNIEKSRLIVGLTVGRYLLPDGTSITGNGVQPDVQVEQPELFRRYQYGTKNDLQFQEAVKILKRK